MSARQLMRYAVGGGAGGFVLTAGSSTPVNFKLNDMAIDSQGNILVAGTLTNGASVGGAGNDDPCVMKFTATGDLVWQKMFGTSSQPETGFALALDASDNIYVGGRAGFSDTSYDLMVAKLDSAGNWLWCRTYGGTGVDFGINRLAVDSSNRVWAVGQAQMADGYDNASLLVYDSSGTLVYDSTIGFGNISDSYSAIAFDANGAAYMAAFTNTAGYAETFVRKINVSGFNHQYTTRYTPYNYPLGMACYQNSVYVCGYRNNVAGMYLLKYDGTTGNVNWSRSISSGSFYATDMAVDAQGNIYICGHVELAANATAIAVQKYDSSGNLLWQNSLQSPNTDQSFRIRLKGDKIYICGLTYINNVSHGLVACLPNDGTGQGTYGAWVYAATNYTPSSGDITLRDSINPVDATVNGGRNYKSPTYSVFNTSIPISKTSF